MRSFLLWTLAVVGGLVWAAPFVCLLVGIWLHSWQWALSSIPVAGLAFIWSIGLVILAARIDQAFGYDEGPATRDVHLEIKADTSAFDRKIRAIQRPIDRGGR